MFPSQNEHIQRSCDCEFCSYVVIIFCSHYTICDICYVISRWRKAQSQYSRSWKEHILRLTVIIYGSKCSLKLALNHCLVVVNVFSYLKCTQNKYYDLINTIVSNWRTRTNITLNLVWSAIFHERSFSNWWRVTVIPSIDVQGSLSHVDACRFWDLHLEFTRPCRCLFWGQRSLYLEHRSLWDTEYLLVLKFHIFLTKTNKTTKHEPEKANHEPILCLDFLIVELGGPCIYLSKK